MISKPDERATAKEPFTFEISLSVLNHLGRNLYRSFATVLGEAISNSWDADAHNVWIKIDRKKDNFFIKDDGHGMDSDDFQNKFLKIGYSKRKHGNESSGGRPFIGRKGIGKLALLSCSDKVSIVSKKVGGFYIGGVIDNSGLTEAIKKDLNPDEYKLGEIDEEVFGALTKGHEKGTIIFFENIKDGIKNREEYLRKIIALYFRFSLIDKSFTIYLNDKEVGLDDLDDLGQKTQFVWTINNFKDPYIDEKLSRLLMPVKSIEMNRNIKGFIASVEKPGDLKIATTDEKVTLDLFVNGRLREKDILRHLHSERLVDSYIYGQIHIDELDGKPDRFTSSREGIVADDPMFKEFMEELKEKIQGIFNDWDKWRIKHRSPGDSENPRLSRTERSSGDLFDAVSGEFKVPKPGESVLEGRVKIEKWADDLKKDATFNFTSYAECFISENLIRAYIRENKICMNKEARSTSDRYKQQEVRNKRKGNVSIELRRECDDLSYLDMAALATMVDKTVEAQNDLATDAKSYRPVRDALMHTSLLTDEAKRRLTTVHDNVKGRLCSLLEKKEE